MTTAAAPLRQAGPKPRRRAGHFVRRDGGTTSKGEPHETSRHHTRTRRSPAYRAGRAGRRDKQDSCECECDDETFHVAPPYWWFRRPAGHFVRRDGGTTSKGEPHETSRHHTRTRRSPAYRAGRAGRRECGGLAAQHPGRVLRRGLRLSLIHISEPTRLGMIS